MTPLQTALLVVRGITALTAVPQPLLTVLRVVEAGLSLAVALAERGADPLAEIAQLERVVGRFDGGTEAAHEELREVIARIERAQ